MSSFPIFGEGGREETDLMKEQTILPHETKLRPSMEYSDPAKKQEELEIAFHAAAMRYQPELTKAQDARNRALGEVRKWTEICGQREASMMRLRNMAMRGSLSYEDDEPGDRGERLKACAVQLEESRAELQAALEELATAEQKVKRLIER